MEFRRNTVRDIKITDCQIYHVYKGVEVSKTTGTIFHHPKYPVNTFGNSVGNAGCHETHYMFLMTADHKHELTDRFDAAFQSAGAPLLEEFFR